MKSTFGEMLGILSFPNMIFMESLFLKIIAGFYFLVTQMLGLRKDYHTCMYVCQYMKFQVAIDNTFKWPL